MSGSYDESEEPHFCFMRTLDVRFLHDSMECSDAFHQIGVDTLTVHFHFLWHEGYRVDYPDLLYRSSMSVTIDIYKYESAL